MTCLILSNPTKPECGAFAETLGEALRRGGDRVCFAAGDCLSDARPDLIVLVGGDGTVLQYAEDVLRLGAPVLGVNFGHRGYLTACEPQEAQEKIQSIRAGACPCEKRSLLEGVILAKDGSVKTRFTGLNEAVLSRGTFCRAISFTLCINENPVNAFPADGVIVATATGSTAYNFSAGGPVLMPEAENLVVTPICASTLMRTSLVISGTDEVELTLSSERGGVQDEQPLLVVDGFKKFPVAFDDRVRVRRSKDVLPIYGGESGDFLRLLQRKMSK